MKIKSIENFELPGNLFQILQEEEYFESEDFDPILITIEEIQYKGEDVISYQAEFEVLEEYDNIYGYEWEELIRKYIEKNEPELLEFIKGDSESSTCVIWTNNQSKFKKILGRMIELIENSNEVNIISEEASL
ncbi:Imm51 family immunity protein [Maribacter sp. Asnod1-A12]|uniref:Imm51 family immunity protein n=1 Tax=Maribacter sp. Asnod1-A12 TaxID=3160576 RepID=UPI00386D8D67